MINNAITIYYDEIIHGIERQIFVNIKYGYLIAKDTGNVIITFNESGINNQVIHHVKDVKLVTGGTELKIYI